MSEKVETIGLKQFALGLGFQTVGVCSVTSPPHIDAYRRWIGKGYHGEMSYLREHFPLKEDPENLLPGATTIVACAMNYYQPLHGAKGQPKIARYALGRDYHKVLRGKLRKLGLWIQSEYPGAQSRACVDSAPILERDFAQQAGLGFIGKNTMLIDPRRGSWFFLGLLLTTVPFENDKPSIGACGSCTKCIETCPTGAIIFEEDRWQLDARRCISYLTIEKRGSIDVDLQPKIGEWTFGCDVCQEVCPFNEGRSTQPKRALLAEEEDLLDTHQWPSLEEVADMDERRWDELTRGSAIRRAGLEGLRRNARINLNNLERTTSEND